MGFFCYKQGRKCISLQERIFEVANARSNVLMFCRLTAHSMKWVESGSLYGYRNHHFHYFDAQNSQHMFDSLKAGKQFTTDVQLWCPHFKPPAYTA